MRRISILATSLVTSFVMLLTALAASPARAASVETVICGTGTYTKTTDGSVVTFSDAGTCTGDLVIPEGVTAISQYAFGFGGSEVTSVSLPVSLNQISSLGPFYGTGALTAINVASTNASFASVAGVLFGLDGASATLFAYPANKVGSTYTTPTSVSFAGESPTPVTNIAYYAFQASKSLTTLNISEGVTTIMSGIAESATLLSAINLPNSYTQMIAKPFSGASGITSLHIGKFLTSIEPGAFYQTGNLNSITVDGDNPNYSARDGVLFDNGQLNQLKLHTYPSAKNEPNYVVPDDVTHIESSAFDSTKVRTLSIPKSVSNMGLGVFVNTSALTSFTVAGDNDDFSAIDGVLFNKPPTKLIAYPQANIANSYAIPPGAEIIGQSAFMSASNLTSVVIPSSVSTFENSAFFCAGSLSKFYFLGNAPTSDPLSCLGGEPKAYVKNANVSSFTPLVDGKWNGLTVSEFAHFVNYDSKGGSAVSIGSFLAGGNVSEPTAPTRDGYGFIGWSTTNSVTDGGTAVTFPYEPGVTSDITLFANWFRDGNYECSTGAWTAETTDTYTVFGGVVDSGSTCTGDVVIPEGVTQIGANAFASSTITGIDLPASVTYIAQGAFFNSALESVSFAPNGNLQTIGLEAFRMTKLISISIPEGVQTIEESAFNYIPTLTSVTIPSSVSTIDGYNFYASTSLNSVFFLGDAPASIGPEGFTEIGTSVKIYIKSGNDSFTRDTEDKWNGLTVAFFDHVVTYNSNGGSAVSAGGFTTGGDISAPTAPTRADHTFAGWSRTNGGAAVVFAYAPGGTSDITLFAKWDIDIADQPVTPPVVPPVIPPADNTPPVDLVAQAAAADLAARTVGTKKSFPAKSLAANIGIKNVSPKAKVTFSIAKSSKKVCSKSGSKIKTLSVGNCVVTFTVQEPKPKKGKKPKATKTVKTLLVQ